VNRDRRDLLSTPVPRWFSIISVVALVAAGIVFVVLVKEAPHQRNPVSTRSAVSVTIPSDGIPGVTPQTAPDYTALVLEGGDLTNLNLPGMQPSTLPVDVGPGQVGTIGNIIVCAAGRPGSVQIVRVAALRATHPLQVVGFSTRPVESEALGFNLGPLDASGFPPRGAEVAPCHGTYQQALIGVHNVVTTEVGIEFEMTSSYVEEDKGLVLTYQGADGTPRSLDVPIDVTFCAKGIYCARSADP
jgi:hypothetical protein